MFGRVPAAKIKSLLCRSRPDLGMRVRSAVGPRSALGRGADAAAGSLRVDLSEGAGRGGPSGIPFAF